VLAAATGRVVELPPPSTRFLRDTLDLSDIERCRPAPQPGSRPEPLRDTMDATDIDGAFVGWKPAFR
jgi:hypothetical protein